MPPDDLILDPTTPEPESPATPALSADTLREAISGVTAPMEARAASDQQTIADLQQRLATAEQSLHAPPAPSSDDYNEKLYSNAQDTIAETARQEATGIVNQLAPVFQEVTNLGKTAVYDRFVQDVDAEFGEGAWAEEFAPVIDARIEEVSKTNVLASMNTGWMNQEVLAVKGLKRHELSAREDAMSEQEKKDKLAEREEILREFGNTTTLSGGLSMHPRSRDEGPSEVEKDYLDQCRRAGVEEISLDTLRDNMASGNSIDDWQAIQDAKKE